MSVSSPADQLAVVFVTASQCISIFRIPPDLSLGIRASSQQQRRRPQRTESFGVLSGAGCCCRHNCGQARPVLMQSLSAPGA